MVAPLERSGERSAHDNQGGGLSMPNIRRDRGRRTQHPWRGAVHRTVAVMAALFLLAEVAVVAVSTVSPGRAQAAQAPPGQGFTVTSGDLKFILKQINIAERHAAE